ncbi:hypothetical protein [Mycobacterium innocens]|uniref:hypothetical protein n=1 Tax=Mycobacterium innocens TaxID=2341083 RepID=UPI001FC900B9|nr:hypothetical protein [Mycobacterium innocens]
MPLEGAGCLRERRLGDRLRRDVDRGDQGRRRVRILAVADAEKMKIQAEAAASHNRVALDRMLIDQLPVIVEKAARGLAGANLTVLNGAEGLSQVAAGLVSQGVAIFDALRGGTLDYDEDSDNVVSPLTSGAKEGA